MTCGRAVRQATATALALYMLLLATATHWPSEGAGEPPGPDKLLHFAAYAVLGVLAGLAYAARWPLGPRAALVLIGAIAVLGAVDEYTQRWAAGRTPDPWDWLADTLGAVAGVALVAAWRATWRPSGDRWKN